VITKGEIKGKKKSTDRRSAVSLCKHSVKTTVHVFEVSIIIAIHRHMCIPLTSILLNISVTPIQTHILEALLAFPMATYEQYGF